MRSDITIYERDLPDGRRVEVLRMIYNDRIVVGDPNSYVYDSGWCYPRGTIAKAAAEQWDGAGDPVGWMKNLQTGEYRENYSGRVIA